MPLAKRNPFQPGYGEIPPVLAGRDQLKLELRDRIDATVEKERHPTAIALIGPRGCGKTALLGWIAKKAKKKKLPVLSLTKQHLQSVDELQNFLIGQVDTKSLLDGLTLEGELKDPTGQLGSLKGEYNWGSESTSGDKSRFLANLLAAASTKGLAILVDEAHDMPAEVGHIFYDAAQSAAQRTPIMLVIAGTPDLKSVLGRSGATFIERMNAQNIGRLSLEDTSRALIEPFGRNTTFDDMAKGVVLRETQNYPYFIQLWGSSLWNVLARKGVTHVGYEEVKEAHNTVDQLRNELYFNRIKELESKGMLVPVAETAIRIGEGGKPSAYEFDATIHRMSHTLDKLEAEEKLLHTGFIWQEGIGNWQFGIPSLATYVREHGTEMIFNQVKIENALPSLRKVHSYFKLAPLLPTSYLEENLRTVLKETGQENQADDHLAFFSELGILCPSRKPDYSLLTAPLLTEAIIAKADRLEAKPEMAPNQEPTLQTRNEPDDFTPRM